MNEVKEKEIEFETTEQNNPKNNNLKGWVKEKRHVQKEIITLEGGKSIATYDGGDLQPIMFKVVNAGEKIKKWDIESLTRILAPKVPTTDALKVTFKAGFVPMTRMVHDYDKLKANKAEIGESLETSLPTFTVDTNAVGTNIPIQQHETWKTRVASFFLPNYVARNIPASVIPIRAYEEFYNAFCRNKMYQPAMPRFIEQHVTQEEKNWILGNIGDITYGYGAIKKDQARNNYYTNIKNKLQDSNNEGKEIKDRTDLMKIYQGDGAPISQAFVTHNNEFLKGGTNSGPDFNQTAHIDWQNQIAEFRRRTNDAIKNDWEIIAELGGTTAVKTDRPEFLGEITRKLNYHQITQSAPSGDPETQSQLGSTGAFSVTMDDSTLFGYKEFKQDGIIIVTATVWSDNTYEEGIHRTAMISKTTDMFNPELAKQQIDVLLKQEVDGTTWFNTGNPAANVVGFKPKYTEFDTMPNLCIRDARSRRLKKGNDGQEQTSSISQWHNMRTLQWHENLTANAGYFMDKTDQLIARNSLQMNHGFDADDQILTASQHYVTVEKHKKLAEIQGFGQEN